MRRSWRRRRLVGRCADVSDYLTGVEAYELDAVEAVLDADPSSSDVVYKETIDLSERAVAAVAAMRAGSGGGGGGSQPLTVVQITASESPYTASAGDMVVVDTTADTVEVNLPASPEAASQVVVFFAAGGNGLLVYPAGGETIANQTQWTLPIFGLLNAVFDGGTTWAVAGQYGGSYGAIVDMTGPLGVENSSGSIAFSPATVAGQTNAIYIGQGDNNGFWEIGFQGGQLSPELDSGLTGLTIGSTAKPWKSVYFTDQLIPSTPPVVPLTIPTVQDVIDALVTLGLVSQSD